MTEKRAASRLWAGLALVVVLGAAALSVWKRAYEPPQFGRVLPTGMKPPASAPSADSLAKASRPPEKPTWNELTPAQKKALAPLKDEWDNQGSVRKRKWLEIANRFAKMTPEEQARAHERMRELFTLTPEQRRAVRENLAKTAKTDPGKKAELWEQYQQLSDEEKKKLAADAASKKLVANVPNTTEAKVKTVAPVKLNPVTETKPAPVQPAPQPQVQPQPVQQAPAATPEAAPSTPPASAPATPPAAASASASQLNAK